MIVKIPEDAKFPKEANAKGYWITEAKRKTRFGPKHILVGIQSVQAPKPGDVYDIEEDIFKMAQDSVWAKNPLKLDGENALDAWG